MSAPIDAETRAVALLHDCGFRVEPSGPLELRVERDGIVTDLEVKVRRAATYRWDAVQLLNKTKRQVLLVVPRAPAGLALLALEEPRVSIAAIDSRVVFWSGKMFAPLDPPDTQRRTEVSATTSRRRPWARWATLRVFAQGDHWLTQTQLALLTGVSQPAISQTLAQLGDVVERSQAGWRATSPEIAWTAFLSEYPGSGGVTTFWYSLDPVVEQATLAFNSALASDARTLLSGDCAADVLAPWRMPRKAKVYSSKAVDLAKVGFSESRPDKATLELTVPADRTLWATAQLWEQFATVDPALAASDVLTSGGPDAQDAVERLALRALEGSPLNRDLP